MATAFAPQLQVADVLLGVVLSSSAAYILFRQFNAASAKVYPPGPPAMPLVGNLLSFSPREPWVKLTEYKHKFGKFSISVDELMRQKFNRQYCILPRPGKSHPFYGKEWREHRKLAHIALSPTALKEYHAIQEDLSALLNQALLDNPEDFSAHIRLTNSRILITVTYGLSIENADDEYITHAEATVDAVARASMPGAFICDYLPFFKYLPSWVPFQKQAAHGRRMVEGLMSMPFEYVKQSMSNGTAPPSLVRELLLEYDGEERAIFEERLKWAAGSIYGAGSETPTESWMHQTYATALVFVMAMALNPEKQALAQAEIDRVVGTERLPVIADRPDLPYLAAVIKETMRWYPTGPLSN
ncbi:hypothetical protein H0H81_012286 [Sphagnurus paluster]|uniref:Cytochrome P450 n=1 Tax=Sphagnurus paluster TaxID=117069 RepID=A0A9P7GJH0_9AGAR|nr:hypothetical protein H0H81_012286 [Sphagnurus paluster]